MTLYSCSGRYNFSAVNSFGRMNVQNEQNTSTPIYKYRDRNFSSNNLTTNNEAPTFIVSDEVIFKEDGSISSQRLTSTYKDGHLTTNSARKVAVPLSDGSIVDKKKEYIKKSFASSKNIKDCIFLMKNPKGFMTQFSIYPDKNTPNKIIVSKKENPRDDFKEVDSYTFDSSSDDIDKLIGISTYSYINMNGFENLYQFSLGKIA